MYYIDFDNTLYETGRLTKEVLSGFTKIIKNETNGDSDSIYENLKNSFNSTIDNFESFAEKMALNYNINNELLQSELKKIILDQGNTFVFPDAINFLKRLKEKNKTICILTFVSQPKNLNQQAMKLLGSGILPYIDEVYSTTRLKFELEIDYKNNTFIDDSPRDLEGLFNSGARKIIRIKKPNNEKRTSKELNIPIEIPTFTSFDNINI